MEAIDCQILEYLKAHPKEFLTVKEISRNVRSTLLSRKGPLWAAPHLKNLHHKGLIEANPMNSYRFALSERKAGKKLYLSPQTAAVLKANGKNFSETINLEEPGETMESLIKNLSAKLEREKGKPS